jgi:hypothetical protein
MAAVRKTADMLEGIVADDLWPPATYQEMLFIMWAFTTNRWQSQLRYSGLSALARSPEVSSYSFN